MRENYLNNYVTKNEIETAIRQLKIKKAVGIDNIPPEIFKMNINWWEMNFTNILNLSGK